MKMLTRKPVKKSVPTRSKPLTQRAGLSKFQEAMIRCQRKEVMPKRREMRALGKVMKNHLLDLDGPKQLRTGPRTRKQMYSSKLFYGFFEIVDSLEMLEDISFLMGRFPYAKTRVSRERFLQFLVEAYFGEIYLLQERLRQYFTLIERQYKADPRRTQIADTCKRLRELCTDVLKGVLQVRHSHVHEARLRDKGLDRLKSIHLVAANLGDGASEFRNLMQKYYLAEHFKIRKDWQQKTQKHNKSIRELVDVVASDLFGLVFIEKPLALRYPSSLVDLPVRKVRKSV